jgi:hypothetical protein
LDELLGSTFAGAKNAICTGMVCGSGFVVVAHESDDSTATSGFDDPEAK